MENFEKQIVEFLTDVYAAKRSKIIVANYGISLFFSVFMAALFYICGIEDGWETNKAISIAGFVSIFTGALVYLLSVTFMEPDPYKNHLKHFYYLMNYLLPGRKNRMERIALMVTEKKDNVVKFTYFLSDEKFKKITKYNIKDWVDQYIGKATSLHNLIMSRVMGDDVLKMGLIFWSQMIPKEFLNVEQYRAVLQSCQLVDEYGFMSNLQADEYSRYFKNYEAKDIVRLFTSPYAVAEYVEILELAKINQLDLEVKRDIRELYLWVRNIDRSKWNKTFEFKQDLEWIGKIVGDSPLGVVKHIDNQVELERWGHYLSNCLRTTDVYLPKLKTGELVLFGIYREDKPYIVFKCNIRGAFVEGKKKANGLLSPEELIILCDYLSHVNR